MWTASEVMLETGNAKATYCRVNSTRRAGNFTSDIAKVEDVNKMSIEFTSSNLCIRPYRLSSAAYSAVFRVNALCFVSFKKIRASQRCSEPVTLSTQQLHLCY